MKHRTILKKLGVMAVAAVMMLSIPLAAPVSASGGTNPETQTRAAPLQMEKTVNADMEGGTYSMVVNFVNMGATYKMYQLLELDPTVKDGKIDSYRYSFNDKVKPIIEGLLADGSEFRYDPDNGKDIGFEMNGNVLLFQVPGGDGMTDAEKATLNSRQENLMLKFSEKLRNKVEKADPSLEPDYMFSTMDVKTGGTVTVEGLTPGYWMVTSNAGLWSVIGTNPSESPDEPMTIEEKNPAPTLEKYVFDASASDNRATASDATIGDQIKYAIEVEAKAGSENLVVVDEMGKGLRLDEIESVKFTPKTSVTETTDEETGKTTSEVTGPVYTFTASGDGKFNGPEMKYYLDKEPEDGSTFNLTINPKFLLPDEDDRENSVFLGDLGTLTDDGGTFEIIYLVTIVPEAVEVEELPNKAHAIFGDPDDPVISGNPDDPDDESNTPVTKTSLYEIDLYKHVSGAPASPLRGAEFYVLRTTVSDLEIASGAGSVTVPSDTFTGLETMAKATDVTATGGFVRLVDLGTDSNNRRVYRPALADETKDVVDYVTTPANGKVVIKGLGSGLYAFVEKKAPAGYNKLDSAVYAVLGSKAASTETDDVAGKLFLQDGTTLKFLIDADGEIDIGNASGFRMPHTGGMGTTVIYAAGAVLVLGAGVLIVVKKRKDASGR